MLYLVWTLILIAIQSLTYAIEVLILMLIIAMFDKIYLLFRVPITKVINIYFNYKYKNNKKQEKKKYRMCVRAHYN